MKRSCQNYDTLRQRLCFLVTDASRPQQNNLALFVYGLLSTWPVHLPKTALYLPLSAPLWRSGYGDGRPGVRQRPDDALLSFARLAFHLAAQEEPLVSSALWTGVPVVGVAVASRNRLVRRGHHAR